MKMKIKINNLFFLDDDTFFERWGKKRKPFLKYCFGSKGSALAWIIIIVSTTLAKYHDYYSNQLYISEGTSIVYYIIRNSIACYIGVALAIGTTYSLNEHRYQLILQDRQNNDK